MNISFKISKENINDETKPNEFIPSDTCITNVPSFTVRNLTVLSKINTEKNWSFEPDSTQPEANIQYVFDVEFLDYKSSMNNNYYGYGNQNRLYYGNQDSSYMQRDQNRYSSISNSKAFFFNF